MAHSMMVLGVSFVFWVMVLAYSAATYDVVKKLKNKESVPDSTVGFVNMMTVGVIIVSCISILYVGYLMYAGRGSSGLSGSMYY